MQIKNYINCYLCGKKVHRKKARKRNPSGSGDTIYLCKYCKYKGGVKKVKLIKR